MSRARAEVLGSYRRLLRACRGVFQRDQHALLASRARVRGEFCKNRLETDREQVAKLLAQAREVGEFLRVNVVQAVRTHDNTYRLCMTKDSALLDNAKLPEAVLTKASAKPPEAVLTEASASSKPDN